MTLRQVFAAAALAAGLAAAPAAATAANVTSHDAATIVAALQNAGYKAKIEVNDGDTSVVTAADGHDITILLAGCTDGKECDQVEFLAFWDCTAAGEMKKCQAMHTKWNAEESFSKTLMGSKNLVLYRHLLLDKPGISEALFIRNLELFVGDAAALLAKYDEKK